MFIHRKVRIGYLIKAVEPDTIGEKQKRIFSLVASILWTARTVGTTRILKTYYTTWRTSVSLVTNILLLSER